MPCSFVPSVAICAVLAASFAAWSSGAAAHEPPEGRGATSTEPENPTQIAERLERQRREIQQRILDLDLPILERADDDPEAFWSFLTDPSTPYAERMAAALRGGETFPLELVPRLWHARNTLEPHTWNVLQHPLDNRALLRLGVQVEEPRTLFGHKWEPLDEPIEWPLTWEALHAAPWPWQVEVALAHLWWTALRYQMPKQRRRQLTDIALNLPRGTDEEANHFANVAELAEPTMALIAELYRIALDPDMVTASHVAVRNLRTQTGWQVPDAQFIAAAFLEDVIRHSPHVRARTRASHLLLYFGSPQKSTRIVPYAAIIAAAERAINEESEMHRLTHALNACRAIPDPPLAVGHHADWRTPEGKAALERFKEWFKANRADLEANAAEQQERIDRARARLRIRGN